MQLIRPVSFDNLKIKVKGSDKILLLCSEETDHRVLNLVSQLIHIIRVDTKGSKDNTKEDSIKANIKGNINKGDMAINKVVNHIKAINKVIKILKVMDSPQHLIWFLVCTGEWMGFLRTNRLFSELNLLNSEWNASNYKKKMLVSRETKPIVDELAWFTTFIVLNYHFKMILK